MNTNMNDCDHRIVLILGNPAGKLQIPHIVCLPLPRHGGKLSQNRDSG